MDSQQLQSLIEIESVQRHRLTLPDELPLSILAERVQDHIRNMRETTKTNMDKDTDALKCFYASVKALYQKYIEADCAPLEINISSRKRQTISEAFELEIDRKCMEMIMEAMGLAADEIVSLLTEAAIRHSAVNERKVTNISVDDGPMV